MNRNYSDGFFSSVLSCSSLVLLAIFFSSCSRPVTEKTSLEIGEFKAAWYALDERLGAWDPSVHPDHVQRNTSDSTGNTGSAAFAAAQHRYQLFRTAYDSVSVVFAAFEKQVTEGELGEEDTRKILTGLQNNLGDATERLDRWEDELIENVAGTAASAEADSTK